MGNTGVLPAWAINLKKTRLEQGLSQRQFGELFGVTKMSVSYWEAGRSEPPIAVLVWMLQHTDPIDVTTLLVGDDDAQF